MTPDPEVPRQLTVPCLNAPDGCRHLVRFMGVKPVRKICPNCLDCGAPEERTQAGFNFETSTRKLRAVIDPVRNCYDSEPVYAVTCWPKTPHGGRVMPCRREG